MGSCMMPGVVSLRTFFCVLFLFTFIAGNVDNDYCEKDKDRCDDEGVYSYMGLTNYDDYAIISIRPKLAMKKTEKTSNKYPNSPRALLNRALALHHAYTLSEDLLTYEEYLRDSMGIYNHILSLPVEVMMPGLLNHACKLMFDLGTMTDNTSTIIEVTTACLHRNISLGNDLIFNLRASQAINLFLEKSYHPCLSSLNSFYSTVEDVQEKTGKPITPQPFLAMLHMVVKRILQVEVSTNQLESLRSILSSLRSADPEVLQQQKDKYDTLVEQSKERMMGEEVMEVMYQVGIDVGIYLSKYQKPTEIIPGLRSKILWDLADLDHNTAKMINKLKENWKTVYEEGLELKTKEVRWIEDKRLIETGSWNQLQLSFIGTSNSFYPVLFIVGKSADKEGNPSIRDICTIAPTTCSLVTGMPSAFCTSKWSVLGPNSHIGLHCSPTNARLRIHLGLKVPEGCGMRIGDKEVAWKEGEIMIFDDSFEHEVWNNGTEERTIFILDIYHPDLTDSQKKQDLF